MEPIFFWVLAVGLVVSAIGLVAFRNPVTSAVCLVVTLVMEAALFVTLEAYFLAVVQVIVYAGAVMVLFLFVIMLLDVKEEARQRPLGPRWCGSSPSEEAQFLEFRGSPLFFQQPQNPPLGAGEGWGLCRRAGTIAFQLVQPAFSSHRGFAFGGYSGCRGSLPKGS